LPDETDNDKTDNGDLPSATVVKDGKVPGDVPRTPPAGGAKRQYKRRWSNYLLDKKLQLRYVLLVTLLSAMIAGSLGYLIWQQEHRASEAVAGMLAEAAQQDDSYKDLEQGASSDMSERDSALVLTMIGTGLGLSVILSLYLILMTHKVAGPLYKTSSYFDQMAAGKLGPVWGLRKGDMLQDFFATFKEMHDAVRARLTSDQAAMEKLLAACKAAGVARTGELGEELDLLEAHVATRKQSLS
jgi:hypothetical protein